MRSASIKASCSTIVRRASVISLTVVILLGLTAQASPAQDGGPDEAHVIFGELNESGISGFSTLTADGNQTVVRIQADGALGNHPTHVHQGQCDDLDPNPEIPLTNVQLPPTGLTGRSETTIDVPLKEILSEDRLILVHQSETDLNSYLACGNVVAGALPEEQRTAGGDIEDPLPGTGAGPVSTDLRFPNVIWLALSAAAVVLAALVARVQRSSGRA